MSAAPSDLGCNDVDFVKEGAGVEPDVGSTSPVATAGVAARHFPAVYGNADQTDAAVWLAGWLVPLA